MNKVVFAQSCPSSVSSQSYWGNWVRSIQKLFPSPHLSIHKTADVGPRYCGHLLWEFSDSDNIFENSSSIYMGSLWEFLKTSTIIYFTTVKIIFECGDNLQWIREGLYALCPQCPCAGVLYSVVKKGIDYTLRILDSGRTRLPGCRVGPHMSQWQPGPFWCLLWGPAPG